MKQRIPFQWAAALLLLLCAAVCAACAAPVYSPADSPAADVEIPVQQDTPYTVLNENQPEFSPEELTTEAFEIYSPLDDLGRCGAAFANVCRELMPTEERGSIGQVKPSGWQTVRYDDLVDGNYLYNRCHLIGFQLTGENANELNLITGTRYMNVDGMLPFENQVADYVQETDNHVLYRVTPVYEGSNLVASGVQMEALSVEDQGDGICFNVYVYNIQPGIEIDYATGNSWRSSTASTSDDGTGQTGSGLEFTYTLNTRSMKFHDPGCSGAAGILPENRDSYTGSRDDLIAMGYSPCGQCQP